MYNNRLVSFVQLLIQLNIYWLRNMYVYARCVEPVRLRHDVGVLNNPDSFSDGFLIVVRTLRGYQKDLLVET